MGGPHSVLAQQVRVHNRLAQQHRHSRQSGRAHRSHTERRAYQGLARCTRQDTPGLSCTGLVARGQPGHYGWRLSQSNGQADTRRSSGYLCRRYVLVLILSINPQKFKLNLCYQSY